MIRAVRTRLGILSALTAGSMALGCGSDGGDGGGGGGNKGLPSGEPDLSLTFSPMYSAYEPSHTYRVPVVVVDATKKVNFRALDPSLVDISRTGDFKATLTMKKAGNTTIVAEYEDGSGWGKSELHISEATKDEWELGQKRYENGIEAFMLPDGGFMFPGLGDGGFMLPPGVMIVDGGLVLPEGGFPFPDGGFPGFDAGAFTANPESACTFCHKPDTAGMMPSGGGLLNLDVEHTPQQIGGYSDEELINIFTMGMKPAGVPMRIATTPRLEMTWHNTHKWQMEEADKKGIIVYIRSLAPKDQGMVDFLGGLFRGDGGFMLPPGLFGDGGFNIGALFDGGFNFGNRGDAGTPPPPPAEDSGSDTEEDAAAPSQEMDAGAG